jgi:hypothetical protein
MKTTQLHCEMFDMRDHMPISVVGEMTEYTLPNGYRVEVVEPLHEVHIAYDDPARGNRFDVTLTAIMPPAMLPSGKHFEQGMRARGTMRLRDGLRCHMIRCTPCPTIPRRVRP